MTSELLKAVGKIAAFPRGGVVQAGTPAGDRDEMIDIARTAVRERYGNIRMSDAIARAQQGA